MKKILLLIAVAFTIQAQAQVDSSLLRSGKLGLRMADWELIVPEFKTYINVFEDVFDSLKNRIRPLARINYPANLTIITIDSITNNELLQMVLITKNKFTKSTSQEFNRIEIAVRAISPWATSRLNLFDAEENAAVNGIKQIGKIILQRRN